MRLGSNGTRHPLCGHADFDAVEEDLGLPAAAVRLNAETVDFGLHVLRSVSISLLFDLLALFGRAAHDV